MGAAESAERVLPALKTCSVKYLGLRTPENSSSAMSKKTSRKRNLEFYRKKSKKFLKRARNRNRKATETIVKRHPRISNLKEFDPETFKLADAQYLIAIGEGETSWSALKRSIGETPNQSNPHAEDQAVRSSSDVVVFPDWVRTAA